MTATPHLNAIRSTHEGVWLRHGLVDIAGDLIAGLLLSQLVYWSGIGEDGQPRMKVERDGHRWLAKAHSAWWNECRVTEDQARRAIPALRAKGLIDTRVWQFQGVPMIHVRLDEDALEAALATLSIPSPPAQNPESTCAESASPSAQNPESYTETTNRDYEQREPQTLSPAASEKDDPAYGFDRFWDRYPRRKGLKVGKAKALERWRRLSYDEKAVAFRNLANYAAAVEAELTIAMDAARWLLKENRTDEQWTHGPPLAVPKPTVAPVRERGMNAVIAEMRGRINDDRRDHDALGLRPPTLAAVRDPGGRDGPPREGPGVAGRVRDDAGGGGPRGDAALAGQPEPVAWSDRVDREANLGAARG